MRVAPWPQITSRKRARKWQIKTEFKCGHKNSKAARHKRLWMCNEQKQKNSRWLEWQPWREKKRIFRRAHFYSTLFGRARRKKKFLGLPPLHIHGKRRGWKTELPFLSDFDDCCQWNEKGKTAHFFIWERSDRRVIPSWKSSEFDPLKGLMKYQHAWPVSFILFPPTIFGIANIEPCPMI